MKLCKSQSPHPSSLLSGHFNSFLLSIMDNIQRFIACFLTGSFAWGMVPAAWALADIAVETSTETNVSVESASEASVVTETGVHLNLGQRIKARCHGLIGPVRVRCVHEITENTHAKAESRFGLWMEHMRDRMEKRREKFEERMKDREEKMEEKIHRKTRKISPEVRARIHAEHKAQVEAARRECQAKETNKEKRHCMNEARGELRAKLKAMIEVSLSLFS